MSVLGLGTAFAVSPHPTRQHHAGYRLLCKKVKKHKHGKVVRRHGKVVYVKHCRYVKIKFKTKPKPPTTTTTTTPTAPTVTAPGSTTVTAPPTTTTTTAPTTTTTTTTTAPPSGGGGGGGGGGVIPVPPVTTTLYSNAPSPLPPSLVSLGFEATQTSEFGGAIGLSAALNGSTTVQTVLDSYACESGGIFNSASCTTTPGDTFSMPVTLNAYALNSDGSVGALYASLTQTFNIPYRPSAQSICNAMGDTGYYLGSDGKCHANEAVPITFNVGNHVFPSGQQGILSVAFNTSDYGAQPYGDATACFTAPQGCPYDSLNVGLQDNSTPAGQPSVGTQPEPGTVYINTQTKANNTNGTAGVFSADPDDTANYGGSGTGYYQPVFTVVTTQ